MLHLLAAFFAGLFAVNATPHFVMGVTKQRFPGALGSGPLVNLLSGWVMYVLAALLAVAAHPAEHPWPTGIAVALGGLAIGVFHATVGAFGKDRATLTANVRGTVGGGS